MKQNKNTLPEQIEEYFTVNVFATYRNNSALNGSVMATSCGVILGNLTVLQQVQTFQSVMHPDASFLC